MKRFALLIFILSSFAFAGCVDKSALGISETFADESQSVDAAAEDAVGNSDISIECAVSVQNFSAGLAEAYGLEKNADAVSTVTGMETAVASVAEGNCDFAIFGGSVKDAEGYEGVTAKIIGAEILHMITDTANSRTDITEDEIFTLFMLDVFFGLGGGGDASEPAELIALALPGEASRVLFEDLFELRGNVNGRMQSLIPETANEFETAEEIAEFIKTNPGAVGVIGGSGIPNGVKGLTIDGVSSDSAEYSARRDVVLIYKEGNEKAEDMVSLIESSSADAVFGSNGIKR